jgi:hypothetical protein
MHLFEIYHSHNQAATRRCKTENMVLKHKIYFTALQFSEPNDVINKTNLVFVPPVHLISYVSKDVMLYLNVCIVH